MKRPSVNLTGLQDQLSDKFEQVKGQRFFKDRLSWAIMVPTLALNAATLILLAVRLHPTGFAVPVHYSSLSGFDALGPWYQSFDIGIFAAIVTISNITLAILSFNRSRITSFFLMIGAFVVALFCLVIGAAFSAIV